MIKVKRIYDPPSPDDGKRILIDRLWPRGMKKEEAHIEEWLKEISPSNELRKWYSHDSAKWPEFKKRYRAEISKQTELLKGIKNEGKKGTVTLLFSSKELELNNAVALKEIVERSK
ncbi:MAG: DUF488 family protein [Thermodesulfobacteriota bacterium]|jgi:uncharacterized protein YeaO (DUF488 family)